MKLQNAINEPRDSYHGSYNKESFNRMNHVVHIIESHQPLLADVVARCQDGRTMILGNMNNVIHPIETTQRYK